METLGGRRTGDCVNDSHWLEYAASSEAVPAATHPYLFSPRGEPSRRRLSDPAIGNRRRLRRILGKRIRQRQPEPTGLCARAILGFYSGCFGGRAGFHRSLRRIATVP